MYQYLTHLNTTIKNLALPQGIGEEDTLPVHVSQGTLDESFVSKVGQIFSLLLREQVDPKQVRDNYHDVRHNMEADDMFLAHDCPSPIITNGHIHVKLRNTLQMCASK